MRRAHRVDDNQGDIVDGLRKVGCSVRVTSMLGEGFPDLIVGIRKRNLMLEVKDGKKPRSKRALTPDEKKFHDEWKGSIQVVESLEEALDYVFRAAGVRPG
jgi:hypothetical protein